jgi:hypothetical protein
MEFKPLTPEQEKELVMIWKRAAPLLEEQRERDIRASDTARDIRAFDDLVEDALRRFPPKESSGMVEMQRYFMRAAHHDGLNKATS